MIAPHHHRLLADIHAAGVAAAQGEALLRRHARYEGGVLHYRSGAIDLAWPVPPHGRLLVVGAGKAAASLAAGLEAVLGDRIDGGCVIVKHGHVAPLGRVRLLEGGHPLPDRAGEAATAALLATVTGLGAEDRVIVALTGGASALLVAPVPPLGLADEVAVSRALVACGAPIEEINAVRRHLSRVRGGGLARAIGPAASLTLAISDVPSRDPAVIGSGPTVATAGGEDPGEVIARYGLTGSVSPDVLAVLARPAPVQPIDPTRHRHLILADIGTALDAAAHRAATLGYAVERIGPIMTGDTHAAARAFAAALRRRRGTRTVLLAGGETTLAVRGSGRGGRNQEFALVAAGALAGADGAALLAAGTDGTDGPTDAAGAFADGHSLAAAAAQGIDVAARLADNDSHPVFAALGDLHVTGPTGTNVMDLVIGVAD